MRLKGLLFSLIIFTFVGNIVYGQNRLNSRLIYLRPPLFNSKSKIDSFDLSGFNIISVNKPIDNRSKFYKEFVYRKKKIRKLNEFFQYPTMIEIQNKINSDLRLFGMNNDNDSTKTTMVIKTNVEVFYPDVRGFLWVKSFAKVRLIISARLKDNELINKKYEYFYLTDGTDKEFEGSLIMSIEQVANVTIGMALRKALDEFYCDLKEKIKINP